jgi:hypothetical protein
MILQIIRWLWKHRKQNVEVTTLGLNNRFVPHGDYIYIEAPLISKDEEVDVEPPAFSFHGVRPEEPWCECAVPLKAIGRSKCLRCDKPPFNA